MLDQAVKAILKGMDKLIGQTGENLRGEIKNAKSELRSEFKTELGFVRDDIKGLTAELSDTPSKREFNELKSRVDKYHPAS
ncbi:MAG: hypothetical protein UT61_C0001G0024 [Candidatus Woesebacteria bacterium GW2011_GWA1_39_8]|nr:MAG: hypothetical protein UT61_C0001G0024 [Candidatus Woesebacteria bacterium GW2011_GWA1_39_8]